MHAANRGASRRRVARLGLVLVAVLAFTVAVQPAAQSDEFRTGDATANADTFSLNLKAASATIGFTYGRSIAGYQDRTAKSEGRALDLGALPALFGGEQCDGSPPMLNPDTLPPVTTATSGAAGAEASKRAQAFQPGLDGGPAADPVGFQDATATPTPSATATTESVPADIFLVAIDGGRTETSAKLEGHLREAHAVVTADRLRVFGGLFTFEKPRWEALARSGDQTVASGSFTFESATVLGFPRSASEALADLDGFKAGLEQLLAPLGVILELPKVVVEGGSVKVTPMGFRIQNPPFGKDVLMPFLGQIDPLIQRLRQQALDENCKNATVLTVIDVILGVFGGSGSIEALAGGVQVATTDTDYSVPPIPDLPNETVPDIPLDTTPAPEVMAFDDTAYDVPAYDSGYTDLGSTEFDTFSEPIAAVAPTAAAPKATTSGLPTASLNRFEDGTAGAAAVAVGVLALVGALALSMGDRLNGRRAKRRIT